MKKMLLFILESISEIGSLTWLVAAIILYNIGCSSYKVTHSKLSFAPYVIALVCAIISLVITAVYISMPAYYRWKEKRLKK